MPVKCAGNDDGDDNITKPFSLFVGILRRSVLRTVETSCVTRESATVSRVSTRDFSMNPALKIYEQPEDEGSVQPATVKVCLGDLLPILALLHRRNFAWLRDFVDDEVVITADLYQILRTFTDRMPSA
jgi:hypothetical protein